MFFIEIVVWASWMILILGLAFMGLSFSKELWQDKMIGLACLYLAGSLVLLIGGVLLAYMTGVNVVQKMQ